MRARAGVMRLAESRAFRLGGRLLAVALLVLLTVRLVRLWDRHPVDFQRIAGGTLAAAVVLSALAVSAYGLVWPVVLRRLGVHASASWVVLFFRSQLGKYLPGSVWQYAGRVGLATRRGVTVQTAFASVVVEVVASALAAAAVGSLTLSSPLLVVCVGAAVAVAVLIRRLASSARPMLAQRPALATGLRALPVVGVLYVLVWGLYGVAFWTTARALFGVSASQLPYDVGAFALGWLVGLVAVFAPGGIGVREAVLTALLSGRLGEAHAIALAGTSRIVLTAADLVFGLVAVTAPFGRSGEQQAAGP